MEINTSTVDVTIHGMAASDGIDKNRPGRTDSFEGDVCMTRADWLRVVGKKGNRVYFPSMRLYGRVDNEPLAGATSDTVILKIKPAA